MEINCQKNRFEKRMKGILSDRQIQETDSLAAAHRIISNGNAEEFLFNPEKYLRNTDKPAFFEMVRKNVKGLITSNIEEHTLCKHLNGHRASSLAGEAIFWDIQTAEGQPQLKKSSAEAIFIAYEILRDLPTEAHQILFPIYFKGYGLGHSLRVGIYSSLIAQKLDNKEIPPEKAGVAGFLHDIGKMQTLIDNIVRKERKLSNEEYELVKIHPVIGVAIWNELLKKRFIELTEKDHLLVHDGVLDHHARPDGKGYPDWINPKNISFIGKIIAIADSFDAMTSHRKYNGNKNSKDYAKEELKRCSGITWDKSKTGKQESEMQFDPELTQLFIDMNPKPIFHQIET